MSAALGKYVQLTLVLENVVPPCHSICLGVFFLFRQRVHCDSIRFVPIQFYSFLHFSLLHFDLCFPPKKFHNNPSISPPPQFSPCSFNYIFLFEEIILNWKLFFISSFLSFFISQIWFLLFVFLFFQMIYKFDFFISSSLIFCSVMFGHHFFYCYFFTLISFLY